MKYTLILISSIWLQTSVQADWWNPGNMNNMNPMGFMNKMPRSMNKMPRSINNMPFSNMDPLTMFPDPQVPQVQFTPPNMADAKNMGNILQNMPNTANTMPNNMYNMSNINPWNQQQNRRNTYPNHALPRQNVWQQPTPYASQAQVQQQSTPSQNLQHYGRPDGRGSYYGANWSPFIQSPPQTLSRPHTNSYYQQPAYTAPQSTAPVLDNSRAPSGIGYQQPELKRPMPTQAPTQSYQDLFN